MHSPRSPSRSVRWRSRWASQLFRRVGRASYPRRSPTRCAPTPRPPSRRPRRRGGRYSGSRRSRPGRSGSGCSAAPGSMPARAGRRRAGALPRSPRRDHRAELLGGARGPASRPDRGGHDRGAADQRGPRVTPVARDELVYVSRRPARTATPVTARRLAEAQLVMADTTCRATDSMRLVLRKMLHEAGHNPQTRIEVEDVETAVELMGRGLADTVVPRARPSELVPRLAPGGDLDHAPASAVRDLRHRAPRQRQLLARRPADDRARRPGSAGRRTDGLAIDPFVCGPQRRKVRHPQRIFSRTGRRGAPCPR